MNNIKVFKDADAIAAAAADYVVQAAQVSIADHGVFNLVLSGGSTPRKLYELLAQRTDIDWPNWQFFMGDERYVPLNDDNSNQHMAAVAMFSKLNLSDDQIHPVPVDQPTVEAAAQAYEKQIREYFRVSEGEIPSFDLVLLGMGSDGHTASLFPGKPALKIMDKLVVASPPGVLPPPVDRVTFTLPLINSARRVLFMAAGEDKAEAFKSVSSMPAGQVQPKGELLWYVDQATAGS